MTQELTTLDNIDSTMQARTDKVLPVKHDAKIESFAKYMLTLLSEMPNKPNPGTAVLIDNEDNTNTAA